MGCSLIFGENFTERGCRFNRTALGPAQMRKAPGEDVLGRLVGGGWGFFEFLCESSCEGLFGRLHVDLVGAHWKGDHGEALHLVIINVDVYKDVISLDAVEGGLNGRPRNLPCVVVHAEPRFGGRESSQPE